MPPNVLLIDDEPMLLTCLRLYLEDAGYRVTTATSGATALDGMQTNQPDVIVSDLYMPEMNGLEFCHRVRQNPEWQNIRLILLTASLEQAYLEQGICMQIESYLIKPFEAEDLLSALRNGQAARSKP
jgi:two-component system, OmpR family, alkaline phosphatase synthesis response regulator PhoP